jgi:PilZ domain
MSPLELLPPEIVEAIPFSVRLAERRLAERESAARADRRAHLRRSVRDLEWLQAVRLTGGTGYDVRLVDLSEGGALLELDTPLRPGVTLTLEMSGPGIDTAVPLEILRCYVASLRGETATYRGACAFAHLIELPARPLRTLQAPAAAPAAPQAASFVGTEAALTYLLERCAPSRSAVAPGSPGIALERTDVIKVLDALRARTSTRGSDLLSRHASDLLSAVIPALHAGAPRDVAVAALDERMRELPRRWRSVLQPTSGRLMSLIDHCAAAADSTGPATASEPAAEISSDAVRTNGARSEVLIVDAAGQARSAFQKIVVRHADGQIVKGYSQDFHPSRPQFSLWPSINATPKERIVVAVARLKALFFVRDFEGNPKYQESKAFGTRGQGRRVEVTFADGEVVLGTTLNYRPDTHGFFVSPADPASNNTRIFVVTTALRRVRFL